jgi:hypothetical protein
MNLKIVILAPIIVILALASTTPTLAFAHTAAYNAGFNQEKRDLANGGSENAEDLCSSLDYTGTDFDHCVTGANDAINGH